MGAGLNQAAGEEGTMEWDIPEREDNPDGWLPPPWKVLMTELPTREPVSPNGEPAGVELYRQEDG